MTEIPTIEFFPADEVRRLLTFGTAINAIEGALLDGLDPELDGPRLFADAPNGEFLIMPSQSQSFCGIKALTSAPDNPARGLEKIQGLYLLYSADTLAPVAVIEGACLTAIRTPSVTLAAVRHLARLAPAGEEPGDAPRITVFGAGTQAVGHVRAALVDFPRARFEIVGRRQERVAAALRELSEDAEASGATLTAATDAEAAVARADIIITATTSTTPVFDGGLVRDGAIVAATGTHGRDARELDDRLVSRADLVVEGRDSAHRENGNLVTALTEADWAERPPANLRELVTGDFARTPGRPACYSGVGMPWEDLVCASAVFSARTRP